MSDNITAFKIINFDRFYESITNEAFNSAALLTGKNFFRKNKKDMNIFKKHVIDKKEKLIPKKEYIMKEMENFVFSTDDDEESMFILLGDMEYIIRKIADEITYNIMSHLTDNNILEMCYSSEAGGIIWRTKK